MFFATIIIVPAIFFFFTENNSKTGPFVAALYIFLVSSLNLIGLDITFSFAIVFILMMVIYFISSIKYKNIKETLFYNDIFVFDKLVWREIEKIIPFARSLIAVSIVFAIGAAYAVSRILPSPMVDWRISAGLAIGAGLSVLILLKRARRDILGWTINSRHISTFFITMLSQKFKPSKEAKLDLPLVDSADLPVVPVQCDNPPHIIFILQEALWNPVEVVPQLDRKFQEYFNGSIGQRKLKVEVFGGGTIISLMSALTGLPSEVFGSTKAHAPRIWKGRIHLSLPTYLSQFRYEVSQFVSAETEWMRVGSFYKSLGVQHLFEPEVFTSGKYKELMHKRDSIVLEAALNSIVGRVVGTTDPTFTIIETSGNHTPYTKALFGDDPAVEADRLHYSKVIGDALPRTATEYVSRLSATVSDFSHFMLGLKSALPETPFVIIQFGDHQPKWLTDLPYHNHHYETALVVNYLNYDIPKDIHAQQDVSVCNLDLFVAKCAGLPLNGYLLAKEKLINKQGQNAISVKNSDYLAILSALRRANLIDERS